MLMIQSADSTLRRSYNVKKGSFPEENGEAVDPTGVADPAPYPGLIIEEMMESASEAGEAQGEKVSDSALTSNSVPEFRHNSPEIYFRVCVLSVAVLSSLSDG